MLIQDITPARNREEKRIAKMHYSLTGMKCERMEIEVKEPYIIDKTTGCYFVGNRVIHTDECLCGENIARRM